MSEKLQTTKNDKRQKIHQPKNVKKIQTTKPNDKRQKIQMNKKMTNGKNTNDKKMTNDR